MPDAARDSKSLENFVSDYMNGYREYITSKDMDEIHTPQFFKGYPFSADIFELPNGAVCALFRKSNRSKYSAQQGDFEDLMVKLKDPDFDFMQVFPPFTEFTAEEAKRLARTDADRDLKSSRRLEMLTAAESHIADIHNDIQAVVDLNPWLDQQTMEQKKKLDRARELILELFNEVDISREERFSDYLRQLTEVMAFEKGEMEEVTGEMSIQMETALQEMDARLDELEDEMAAREKESADAVKGIAMRLNSLEKGGSTKELASSLSKLQSAFRDLSREFQGVEKTFDAQNSEYAEVKDTVERDSKRTYNLNERVTDLERATANLKKEAGKDNMAAVKALEGRMNVMEKDLRTVAKKAERMSAVSEQPVVVESPVVETVETTPDGKTVKKTVKRTTTTKKTTRSK